MHKVWYDIFTKKSTESFNMEKLRTELNSYQVHNHINRFFVSTHKVFLLWN